MASAKPAGGQAYFDTRRGEVDQLRTLLRKAFAGKDATQKKDVIKKIIAYMTLGIDVSPLFSDMVMVSVTQGAQ